MLLRRPLGKMLAISSAYALILGCAQQGYTVIAASNTTIGVGISQQPTNGAIDATLGYKRQEFAFIPTNRLGDTDQTDAGGANAQGAKDTGNVIMEIRQAGIFSMSKDSGIYQRLAVGDIAVQQSGATLMFAKGHDGELDADTKQALVNIAGMPSEKSSSIVTKANIRKKYDNCVKTNNSACTNRIISEMRKIQPGVNTPDELFKAKPTEEQLNSLLNSI